MSTLMSNTLCFQLYGSSVSRRRNENMAINQTSFYYIETETQNNILWIENDT